MNPKQTQKSADMERHITVLNNTTQQIFVTFVYIPFTPIDLPHEVLKGNRVKVDISQLLQDGCVDWIYAPCSVVIKEHGRIELSKPPRSYDVIFHRKYKAWDYASEEEKASSLGRDAVVFDKDQQFCIEMPEHCANMLWCVKKLPGKWTKNNRNFLL